MDFCGHLDPYLLTLRALIGIGRDPQRQLLGHHGRSVLDAPRQRPDDRLRLFPRDPQLDTGTRSTWKSCFSPTAYAVAGVAMLELG